MSDPRLDETVSDEGAAGVEMPPNAGGDHLNEDTGLQAGDDVAGERGHDPQPDGRMLP